MNLYAKNILITSPIFLRLRNMGHGSHITHVLSVIIFLLITLYCIHIFVAKASFNLQGYLSMVSVEYNGAQLPSNTPEKLRFFLNNEHSRYGRASTIYLNPSPSPSPASPAVHAHTPLHHHRQSLPQTLKIHKKDQGKSKRVVIEVVVSVVGVACLICGSGLFLGCKKQMSRRRRHRSVLILRSEYALEQEKSCLKQKSNIQETQIICTLDNSEVSNKMNIDSQCDREIKCCTVHDIQHESNKHSSDSWEQTFNDRKIVHSPDDDDHESFHSFHSASSSLGETSEIIISQDHVKETNTSFVQYLSPFEPQTGFPAGVPPPPPPPPCPPVPLKSATPQVNQQVTFGKDGSFLPKLKPLHWDKVRAAPNRSTVWDKLRSSSFKFDEEMIEKLFGYKLNPITNEEVKRKISSPSKHVLEPKRLQNITILSKGLNVTTEQVCGALIRGDGLSLQDLEALSKMVPTKEEESKLANYKGEVLELYPAEKLVKAMLKIPFAFSRIEAMLYRETFEDEVLYLRKSFSMLEEACKELRSSRLFLKLLEAVLKTGNRMNVGTIRGGAKAFKLDALLKLADVKGTDGKTTLLHFVVQEIIRSEGISVSESIMGKIHQSRNVEDNEENYWKMGLDFVSGLSTELHNAKKTATIDLDVIASSVSNLSDGMEKLRDLVHREMIMEEKKGNFVSSMRLFLKYVEMKLNELHEDENRVLSHVREISEYFHGDLSKDEPNPLRIFVIVRDFLSMLDNVCRDLRSSKAPRSSRNPLALFQ